MKLPFFYGWIIVGIAMLAGFLGSGVSNVTMAVALKPITEDLGWSRTLTSSAITIGSVAGGLLAPLIGPLADRLGPRILLPFGAALVGTFVMCLSLTYEPWQFYATFVPARGLAETLLTGVVPSFLANAVPGALGVRPRTYLLGSALGVLPGIVVYAGIGAGLSNLAAAEKALEPANVLTTEMVVGLAGLVVLALTPVAYKYVQKRRHA